MRWRRFSNGERQYDGINHEKYEVPFKTVGDDGDTVMPTAMAVGRLDLSNVSDFWSWDVRRRDPISGELVDEGYEQLTFSHGDLWALVHAYRCITEDGYLEKYLKEEGIEEVPDDD